jgi:hypothetical protein
MLCFDRSLIPLLASTCRKTLTQASRLLRLARWLAFLLSCCEVTRVATDTAITMFPQAPSIGRQLVAYVRSLQAHELEETTNELRRTLRRLGGRLCYLESPKMNIEESSIP